MPRTPAQLPKPISVLKPPLVAAGGFFISLSVATFFWALFAKVPEKVYGTGALTHIDSAQEIKSQTQGYVVYPVISRKQELVWNKRFWGVELYEFIKSPETFGHDQMLKLAKFLAGNTQVYKTQSRANMTDFTAGADFGASRVVNVSEGDVLARIENDTMRQNLQETIIQLSKVDERYNQMIANNQSLLSGQNQLLQSRQLMVPPIRKLQEKGYSSKVETLRAQSEALNEKLAIKSTEAAISELELKLEKAKSDLRKELYEYIEQSFLFAFEKGRIESLRFPQWAFVSPGQTILQMSCNCNDKDFIIPVAVDQATATRLAPGMKAILTPVGLNPSEVGGIRGQVTALSPDPIDVSTLAARLGSPGLASLLEQRDHVTYIAYIKLATNVLSEFKQNPALTTDQNNRGIFQWNNRSNPPVKPREGILLSAQITTRNRSPIEMILPSFKEFIGRTTPYDLIKKERG